MAGKKEMWQSLEMQIAAFPRRPTTDDWEEFKTSLSYITENLEEPLVYNFADAFWIVPHTEAREAMAGRIAELAREAEAHPEHSPEWEEIIRRLETEEARYEAYIARTLRYLGWRVGRCRSTKKFLLSEEVEGGVCSRCPAPAPCQEEGEPNIVWKDPVDEEPPAWEAEENESSCRS